MSIYRNRDRGTYGNYLVDPPKPTDNNVSAQESPGTAPRAEDSGARLRRLAPSDQPFAPTLKWVASLPPNVQPLDLLRHFPRIANSMAGAWNDPKAFRAQMDDLLIDRRSGREGFPTRILGELLTLRLHYDDLHPAVIHGYRDTGKRG
ncbi:MAG: hypothetical protein GZ089_08320 [Aromatoleum sp.]|nr:hypothetical protein [Aromatoleum sp.]